MDNPKSGDVAALFMAEGRNGTGDHSDSFTIDACNPQLNLSVGPFDLQGRTPNHPAGVDYDMKPMRLNPRSVAGQSPEKDAQGK
jgi:hypothetical protein